MNTSIIEVNSQSSIRLALDSIIYFDPYEIKEEKHDADIIFITHSHYDHLDPKSIDKIKNNNTIVVAPKSIKYDIERIIFKDYI